MSGVQVDQSPAVATHSLDLSSWTDADLSALTSSEKKRYYIRKSAIQDYFTTKQSLGQIASRYRLSFKTLGKLVKRCQMRHEDGAPWGYRALVPGVTVIDHLRSPEPESESAPASTNDAMRSNGEEVVQEDGNTPANDAETPDFDLETFDNRETPSEANDANGEEARDEHDVTPRESADDGANDDTESAGDEQDETSAGSANVGEAGDEETDAQAEVAETDTAAHGEAAAETDTAAHGEADAINRVPTETVVDRVDANNDFADADGGADAETPGTRLIASDPAWTTDSPFALPSIPDSPLDEASAERDEDTAPRKAIVLTKYEPVSADDMPNIAAIEEMSAENHLNGHGGMEMHTPLPDVSEGDSGEFNVPELASPENRSIVVYKRLQPGTLPRTSKKHIAAIRGLEKRTVISKRSIRRRWVRSEEQTRKRKSYRLIGGAVVAVMLLSLLIPVGAGLAAYSAYNSIKGIALDGVNHLLDIKTLLPVSKNNPTAALNPVKLQQASADFTQSESDFLQLQQLINRPDIQGLVQQFAPQYSNKLGMAQHLVQVGIDVTRMGGEFIGIAMLGANILHGSPLAAGSTKPLITVADISNIEGTILHALYYVQDIKAQMSQVSLSQLPISTKQQQEIASAMTLLPKAQNYLEQAQGMMGIVSWLLGVGQARRFLVQTMDRAELRPGGGFTGQYGVLTIQDGRMAPFTLQDVTELDYNGNGAELGRQAPPGYTSWMNFGNFGLRDANLSGDFPTTARLAMQVFQEEGGGPVDGDIAFTPTAIQHVLDVIGPLKISSYNDTITAQNLEDKLHYYQNDPAAIALQREKTGTHNAATRKSFTALVGSTLLSTVRHLPVTTLLKVAQNATKDISSRDLEIYFNNPQAEGWLVTHSFSGAMSTFSQTDGFMVVQSNISISKASSDVQTTEQDNIVLDAQGGATHNLTITLDYEGTKPIYSVYTTYADYIRVYAPANAVLQGGFGFDTGKALCSPTPVGSGNPGSGKPPKPNTSGGLQPCGQYASSSGNSALYCPSGNYSLGQRGWIEGKGWSNWSVEKLGGPTELTSDLPGRAMWGGLTVTPKNCISTITLSWYVPNAVKHVVAQPLYSVLVQKQGGYIPVIQISIDTSQLKGVKPYSFNGNIYADRLFSLPVVKKSK